MLLGAVAPILVLSYLSDPLGAVPAYLVSALIPVGWVLADLFFLSRRFNFITAFLGLNAIVRGLLAFWFVDGALYAFKDTVGRPEGDRHHEQHDKPQHASIYPHPIVSRPNRRLRRVW